VLDEQSAHIKIRWAELMVFKFPGHRLAGRGRQTTRVLLFLTDVTHFSNKSSR
jgi:hypothetical protein